MKRDINKFYRKRENGSLELLEEYILSYSFFRGLHSDMNRCPIVDLYVDKNRHFECFFVWHKEKSRTLIESCNEGNLPKEIDRLIQNIFDLDFLDLKDSYTDSKDIYVADDIQRESITFNHHSKKCGIDLSPYYFREFLMQTEQEKLVLQLYKEIDVWLTNLFDGIKNEYE